ncbi:MAG TPA: InlB B-repeat-containing protein [Clostridia bacterium]|nr:InlB B-repeat-containing protein [Clostridia bacterium]
MIKKSLCVLLCLLLAFAIFPVKAGAVTIDGVIRNDEWINAEKTLLFPSGSNTNCDINFAFSHVIVDKKANAVYLALNVTQRTAGALNEQAMNSGVKLDMGAGEKIICRFDGTNTFNHSSYSVEQKMKVENISYLFIEIKIGCLFGVPAQPLVGLQLIDSYGQYSNYYKFPLAAEPTAATTKPTTTKKPVTTKPTTTKKPVTTKPTSPELYKVKFDSNGGKGGKTQSLPYGAKPVPPEVNRDGYTFKAWNPQVVYVTGATTYKAQWVKDKNSVTPPTAVPTTSSKTTTVKNGAKASSDNSIYAVTVPSSANQAIKSSDSGTGIHDAGTSSPQSNFDKSDSNAQGDISFSYDSNKKYDNNVKKQVAAVVVAVILLALAGYFFTLASKRKTQPKVEPSVAKNKTDEDEAEDEF